MCGLCGFGLTDAQMVLELDENKPRDEMESVGGEEKAHLSLENSALLSSQIEIPSADRDTAQRSVSALLANAFAVLWSKRVSRTHPAHGL